MFPILHPLPPPSPSHPSGPSQCTSTLYHASNLDWRFISHMIFYMFQCHSPISSRPHPLPQGPKDCSIHLYLFCCLVYRVIVAIPKDSLFEKKKLFIYLFLARLGLRYCASYSVVVVYGLLIAVASLVAEHRL